MKINKSNRPRAIKIAAVVIVAACLIYFASAWALKLWPFTGETVTQSSDEADQTASTDSTPTPIVDENKAPVQSEESEPKTQSDNGDTDPSGGTTSSLPVSITSATQAGDTVQVRSLIETVTTNGSCTLTLTKGSAVVTKTSGIAALSNSSTCKGFDIPVSELSAGTWSIKLSVSSGGKKGSSNSTVKVTP